jgi:hypothetical protein
MEIMWRHRRQSQENTLKIVPGPPRITANAMLFDQSVTTVTSGRAFFPATGTSRSNHEATVRTVSSEI